MSALDIKILDLEFRGVAQTIASYLLLNSGEPVLVESGPSSTLDTLALRLGDHGLRPDDIRHVVISHIHLDHGGAAGWWAQQGAQVYVHEFGAPHLVDPTRLLKSARRIYGDRLEPLFGPVVPAPPENVTALGDGDEVRVGRLRLRAHETPGHARHHHVFSAEGIAFAGDAVGVKLPGSPLIDLPAVPPEFDLVAWQGSVDKLRRLEFSRLYPTHFGPIEDVESHLDDFALHLEAAAQVVEEGRSQGLERDDVLAAYRKWNEERAVSLGVDASTVAAYESVNPMSMSVDGILRYWEKRAGA